MMLLRSNLLGYLIMMMMSIYSSDALEMYPPLRDYDIATNFASFYCINDDADDIEFLYPNFTIIISSYRICVDDGYLTFDPPLLSDAGSYWCRNKTNHSDVAEGKLLFKDTFTVYEEKLILRGFDAPVSCLANASTEQNSTILWGQFYFTNMLISETPKFTINATEMIIHNVAIEDEGEYACFSEEAFLVYTVTDITVAWNPELVSEQDQAMTISVHEEVILNCTVLASPDPVYSWSFPDSCSSCPNISNDSVLTFIAKDTTDNGEYICTAENRYGNLSITFNIIVTIPPTFVFSDDSTLLEDRYTLLGSDVFMNCSVNYGTEYNITSWLFDYEPLLINQTSRFDQNTSGLIIYNVTESDEAAYICYVGDFVIWAIINLHMARSPVLVSLQNQTVTVTIGEEVVLNCSASSVPDPVYSWSFPDSCSSCPNISSKFKSVLNFTATNSGEYTCIAENDFGNLSVTFHVDVIIPPTFVFSNDSVLHEERYAILGSDVFINCSVNYGTEYSITSWVFDDQLLNNQTSKFSQNASGLIIYNITKLDGGCYICIIDELLAYVYLHIEWPPTLVSDQLVKVNVSEEVMLNCTVSSLPDPVYSWFIPGNCSSCPHFNNYSILTFTADKTDSGEYICAAGNIHGNISVIFNIFVNVDPSFVFSSQPYMYMERDSLLDSDIFLNCSVDYGTQPSNITIWRLDGQLIWIDETTKYNVNTSGLTIYNVTAEDEGNYACHVQQLTAITFLHVVWPPEFPADHNHTLAVNVSEEVILNCTVSASPDPVYNWFVPDSCSLCLHSHNKSLMIINITNSGKYTCIAKNEYGNISTEYDIHVNSKPIMFTNITTIRKDQSTGNVMLTCGVKYSYPTAKITWNIMTESSITYDVIEENSTGNYILLHNGSLEVYRRFIYEEDHVTVKCLASNKYGSAETVFSIWDDEYFSQVKKFTLYVRAPSCEEISNQSEEIYQALRKWFDSVCYCDGLNNLYKGQVTCVHDTVGKIVSEVHSDDNNDKTAEMLIDLAKTNMQRRNPPKVKISPQWILCLSENDCSEDDSQESGMSELPNMEFTLFIKNTRCENAPMLEGVIQEWFKSFCNCDITLQITCLDSTTVNITSVFQSNEDNTAQAMIDKIVNYIQEQNYSVVYQEYEWTVCLNEDCDNATTVDTSTTSVSKSDNKNLIPQIVGITVGLILCVAAGSCLCIFFIFRKMYINSRKLKISKHSRAKPNDHIYDELDMYTRLNAKTAMAAKTPSPKSDKVIFDTKGNEPPGYQSLPAPRYERCSATSIAKSNLSNDYYIEEDARSIEDKDCEFLEKATKQGYEDIMKENDSYCKLKHF